VKSDTMIHPSFLASGDDEYPGPSRARFAVAVLAGVGLLCTIEAGLVSVLIEPLKIELDLTDVEVSLANTTVFAIASGLIMAPAGMLADRVNRVRVLLAGMLLMTASLLLIALSHDLWVLMVGKAAMGAAGGLVYPAALSLLSDYFPPDRRPVAVSKFAIGQLLGGAVAVLAGGSAYAALAKAAANDPQAIFGLSPWRAVFLIFAILALLLVPALMALREPPRKEIMKEGSGTLRELQAFRSFLLPLFAGLACLAAMASGTMAWVAPVLMRVYDLEIGEFAGWYGSIQLVTGILGMVLAGKIAQISQRSGHDSRMLNWAALAALLCVPASCMALSPSVPGFAALLTLFGLSCGPALMIPIIAINLRIPNELRGLTVGLNGLVAAATGAASAPFVAKVGEWMGGEANLGRAIASVGAPLALLAAFFFLMAARSKSPSLSRSAARINPMARSAST
jgi:MFS family permease